MSGTLKVTTLQDGASSIANLTFDASGNTTAGGTIAMASSFLRNRIINGAMLIDQRNAGAAVTPTASAYTVDRWQYQTSIPSKIIVQQNAASVTPPAGFKTYLGFTTASAYSPSASDVFEFAQKIEGFNFYDLNWGTANASNVTLSFWVRSSLTGTHSGSFTNDLGNRSYVFTFTVNSANTWEYKTITVAGDTTGTWTGATNGTGVVLYFNLGTGTTYLTTANSWQAGNFVGATGAVQVVANAGATFYITGVQLEVGSNATPFERRQYGTELMLCQRYYWNWSASQFVRLSIAYNDTTTSTQIPIFLPVPLRATPTLGLTNMTSNGVAITAAGVSISNSTAWITAAGTGLTVGATQIYTASGATGSVALNAEL